MRLYNGRLLKTRVRRQITQAQELRDAIVMDVNPGSHYCRVKIQGSNTLIKAWYPENWESTPVYLKPGNAVRINLPGGNKSRIEIMGHGVLLPTAVAGGSVTPEPATLLDTILTGCAVRATNPASMKATIDPGTFRIDGLTYALSGMMMDRSDIVMDRNDLQMDSVGGSVSFDAASTTYFRYDTIQVGTDGIVEVVNGANFSASGTIPGPPGANADHLAIGFVLIPPNCTAITEFNINKSFTMPIPSSLSSVVDDDELEWTDTSTVIHVSIKDQYGNYYRNTNPGHCFTFTWVTGNGTLSYDGESQDETASFSFYYSGSTNAAVTYTRDGELTDRSVTLIITESLTGLSSYASIVLLDSLGQPM